MTTHAEIYDAILAHGREKYPGFDVRVKGDSWLMKVLAKILFFNKTFMTSYVTTIGDVIYVPKSRLEAQTHRLWKTVCHEIVHVFDKSKADFGMLGFGAWYLFPQTIAMVCLVLGAVLPFLFWSTWPLWLLIGLVFAAPLPSPGRMGYEMRGYTMSMAVNYWRKGSITDEQKRDIEENFTGPDYYFMWPFKKSVRDRIDEAIVAIERGDVLKGPEGAPFRDVRAILLSLGVVKDA